MWHYRLSRHFILYVWPTDIWDPTCSKMWSLSMWNQEVPGWTPLGIFVTCYSCSFSSCLSLLSWNKGGQKATLKVRNYCQNERYTLNVLCCEHGAEREVDWRQSLTSSFKPDFLVTSRFQPISTENGNSSCRTMGTYSASPPLRLYRDTNMQTSGR